MIAWFRMLGFHIRQYGRVTYFVRQLIIATVSATLIQWAAALPSKTPLGASHWLLAAHIGMWVGATSAAGILGFQRFQGTLSPLLVAPRPPESTITALIASITCFAVASFPLSYLCIVLLGGHVEVRDWPAVLVGAGVSWVGATAMALVVAPLFVLSPSATTYEQLLVVPIMLAMGLFGYPHWGERSEIILSSLGALLPMSNGFRLAQDGVAGTASRFVELTAIGIGTSLMWVAIGFVALRAALRRSRVQGTLELV